MDCACEGGDGNAWQGGKGKGKDREREEKENLLMWREEMALKG